MLRRLLLLPLLSPFLAMLLVGALNPSPRVTLRLLTWRSPALPVGLWIGAAAAAGAGLSAAGAALALREAPMVLRRRVRRSDDTRPFEDGRRLDDDGNVHRGGDRWEAPRERRKTPVSAAAGDSRAPGEPAPTVAVPFRVIRRGAGSEPMGHKGRPEPEPTPVADDWETESAEDW